MTRRSSNTTTMESETNQEFEPLKHVLVALDDSRRSEVLLAWASQVANALGAELRCLYVEDTELLNVSAFPFAREIFVDRSADRPLTPELTVRRMLHEQERLRRLVRESAECVRVRYTFVHVRGRVAAEVLAAASQAEVLLLGRRRYGTEGSLGRTVAAVIAKASCAVMLVESALEAHLPVAGLYNDAPGAGEVLRLMLALAQADSRQLCLVIAAASAEKARQLRQEAEWRAARSHVSLHVTEVVGANDHRVLQALAGMPSRLLVLNPGSVGVSADRLQCWLAGISVPVLLVPPPLGRGTEPTAR